MTRARRVPTMSTLRGFSSIVAALVGVFGLLASSIGHSSESQIIAIENAGSATLDDQSFHLPLLVTRQLGAFRATDFSMIGARVLRYSNQGELLQAGSDDLVRHQMDRFEGLVAATGGLMFGWSSDREFAAFTSEGTILWTHPAEGSVASPPLVSDAGSIYFVRQKFPSGTEATLHLVELLRDGSQAFEVDLRGAQGLSLPQLELVMTMRLLPVPNSDEMVLVGNMNSHTAIALRIRPDGSVRWYWKAPGRLRSLH